MSDFHAFEADSGIVHHLIHNQNGTVETSIIELICNSIDAKSKVVKLFITKDSFDVVDEGQGFKDKDEIMKFFKKFGTPHKEGDATFGRFRIGRGQIISFSDAVWHSKGFKMETTIKDNAYGFNFTEDENDYHDGCRVYGRFKISLRNHEIKSIEESIIQKLKYVDSKIYINNILISIDNKTEYDYEDEDLKIIWNPKRDDGILLYSQGVYVKDIPRYYYDLNADIITKNALKLNMARNETNDNDPVWIKIENLLIKESQKVAKELMKSKKISETMRRGLIKQFISGELSFNDGIQISLLKDCRGHFISISTVLSKLIPLCIGKESKSREAEWLATRGLATVLDFDEGRLWGVNNSKGLITLIKEIINNIPRREETASSRYYSLKIDEVKTLLFEEVSANIDTNMELLKNKDLNDREIAAKNSLQAVSNIMAKRLNNYKNEKIIKRKIFIGDSLIANGWTDSVTYIAISKRMLSLLDSGFYGAVQLSLLLLHEYIHDKSSVGSHNHDFDFYKAFHDFATLSDKSGEILGHCAKSMMNRYNKELSDNLLTLPKEVYKDFRYPIVNYTPEFDLYLGEKGLSEYSKLILDISPHKVNKSKNKIKILIKERSDNIIALKLLELAKKDGFESNYVSISNDDYYMESIENRIQDKTRVLKEWFAFKGFCDNSIDALFHSFRINRKASIPEIINILVNDQDSDILYYESTKLERIKTHGSKKHNFNFKSDAINSFFYNSRKISQVAESKRERTLEIKELIINAVNGLKDKDEKEAFIKQFLSNDFSKEFE